MESDDSGFTRNQFNASMTQYVERMGNETDLTAQSFLQENECRIFFENASAAALFCWEDLFKERAFDSCCEKTSIHEVFDELRLRTAIENADQELYNKALKIVTSSKDDTTSISYLQRAMNLQYDEAERIMDLLEENGVVSSKNNIHKRTIIR